MNFQLEPILTPVKVLVYHATSAAAQLLMCKILSGAVFGREYKVDLTLVVAPCENFKAENIKLELLCCGLNNISSISISNHFPSFNDADVFCYITSFVNPNVFDSSTIEEGILENMHSLIDVASNLKASPAAKENKDLVTKTKQLKPKENPRKPIFITDGVVALHVFKSLSKGIPSDVFFCPTQIPAVAKSVLADHLKLKAKDINDVLVWGANYHIFKVEFEKPLIMNDEIEDKGPCSDIISGDKLKSLNIDYLNFGPAWMKKEFIEKVQAMASKNPFGCIYKAKELANTLRCIWNARSNENGIKVYSNIGVISDGSLGTIKGLPYILPVIISGCSWNVSERFNEDPHLILEIKKMNKTVLKNHEEIKQYCNKYLEVKRNAARKLPLEDEQGSDSTEYTVI